MRAPHSSTTASAPRRRSLPPRRPSLARRPEPFVTFAGTHRSFLLHPAHPSILLTYGGVADLPPAPRPRNSRAMVAQRLTEEGPRRRRRGPALERSLLEKINYTPSEVA